VAKTCSLFGQDGALSKAAVEEGLAASSSSVDALWTKLGVQGDISCQDMCDAVIAALPSPLPPSCDVGCYAGNDGTIACDVDLDPETVSEEAHYEGDLPDFHDKEIMTKKKLSQSASNVEVQSNATNLNDDEIDYSAPAILRRVANLFRIYPFHEVETIDISADTGSLVETTAGSAWQSDLQKVNVKAIAYVQQAVSKFRSKNTKTHMQKWFGSAAYSSSSSRSKVNKVLNSINAMLDNVEYVYPGPECESNTYAYVYPGASSCSTTSQLQRYACTKYKGKFVFYMCPLTMRSSTAIKIETLTHEGSHHATAYTDDVDFEGGTAYGRSTCQRLARSSASKALNNADNYCYYIQDITDRR
jgi:hypothetical protein